MAKKIRAIDQLADYHPKTRAQWRAWLKKNHLSSAGVWFVYFKKETGKRKFTYADAVEEALCFGWVDSLPRKLDAERSKLLFTPRKPKSVWSALNKQRVARLIADGLMTPAGLAKIEAAQRDGSWNTLDASDNLEIPADLATALANNKTAKKNFQAFPRSAKRAILYWLTNAKRESTRQARLTKLVTMAEVNKRANFDDPK